MYGEKLNENLSTNLNLNSVEAFDLSNAFFFDFLKIEPDASIFLSTISTDDFSIASQQYLLKKIDETKIPDQEIEKEIDKLQHLTMNDQKIDSESIKSVINDQQIDQKSIKSMISDQQIDEESRKSMIDGHKMISESMKSMSNDQEIDYKSTESITNDKKIDQESIKPIINDQKTDSESTIINNFLNPKNFNKIHLDVDQKTENSIDIENRSEPKLAVFSLLSPDPEISTVPKWDSDVPIDQKWHTDGATIPKWPSEQPSESDIRSEFGPNGPVWPSAIEKSSMSEEFDKDPMRKRSQTEIYMRHRSKSDGVIKSALKKSDSPTSPIDSMSALKLKRRVSFADANGHQLEEIRSFEVQNQNAAFYDSESEEETFELLKLAKNSNASSVRPLMERRFVPYFQLPWNQPGKQKLIYAVLEDQKISFETFTINSPWRLSGTILVKNFTFSKRVFARMTLDKWLTHRDVDAIFVASVNANVDRFHFELKFPFKMAPGTRLELAFGYELPSTGQSFWDNNCHNNYAYWFSSSK